MFQVRGPLVSWLPLSAALVVQEHLSTGHKREGLYLGKSVPEAGVGKWWGEAPHQCANLCVPLFSSFFSSPSLHGLEVTCLDSFHGNVSNSPSYLKCKATQLFVAPDDT